MAGKQLATRKGQLTAGAKLPDEFTKVIDLEGWARAIVFREKYAEPNPDYLMAMLAFQTITAETIDAVFANTGIQKVQELVPDTPGGTSGPMELTDLYVSESDIEEGQSCYVIMTATNLMSGEEVKMTTGATNIQATLIGLLKLGHWPVRFQLKRGDQKDKGGRHLLFMLPPD